jgi:hypothetical protein
MNKTLHRIRPYSNLSEQELDRYPSIVDVDGNILRLDSQGVLYERRSSISRPPSEMMVSRALGVLHQVDIAGTPTISGYLFKGYFERFERCGWLPLGAMISAADRIGIPIRWVENTPDVKLGISRKWLREYLACHQGGRR